MAGEVPCTFLFETVLNGRFRSNSLGEKSSAEDTASCFHEERARPVHL